MELVYENQLILATMHGCVESNINLLHLFVIHEIVSTYACMQLHTGKYSCHLLSHVGASPENVPSF